MTPNAFDLTSPTTNSAPESESVDDESFSSNESKSVELISNNSVLKKIDTLEQIIVQQQSYIATIMNNFASISTPKFDEVGSRMEKWRPLIELSSMMITIREKRTLKLLAHNEEFAKMFSKRNSVLQKKETDLKAALGPLITLLLLNLCKENKKVSVLKCKHLYFVSENQCVLLDIVFHFDDDEVLWTEIREIVPPYFDDGWRMVLLNLLLKRLLMIG